MVHDSAAQQPSRHLARSRRPATSPAAVPPSPPNNVER